MPNSCLLRFSGWITFHFYALQARKQPGTVVSSLKSRQMLDEVGRFYT